MKTIFLHTLKILVMLIALQTSVSAQNTNEIFINASSGNDQNKGTKETPLKSLGEAARRVNTLEGKGSITVYLSKGVYGMSETANFSPAKWQFSKEGRLIIRAEKLPDDAGWNPGDMPVMVSTMPFDIIEKNDKEEETGAFNYGILIGTSHVTIEGLRILGEPVHESPVKGILIRNYPIMWDGKDLEDLRVTQCLFLGNKMTLPNHLGILASGRALVVDHCVFNGIKDAVVMWNTPADQCEMHHNLFVNTYGAIVWTWATTEDFKFYNNVIGNANVVWVLNKDEKNTYSIENSVIIGYNELVNKGGGAEGFGVRANPDKIKLGKGVILKKEGTLQIEDDPTSRNYLQLRAGTTGSDLGAGLFTK
jgi:hypothetical protein